jgi:hypothetical protein
MTDLSFNFDFLDDLAMLSDDRARRDASAVIRELRQFRIGALLEFAAWQHQAKTSIMR